MNLFRCRLCLGRIDNPEDGVVTWGGDFTRLRVAHRECDQGLQGTRDALPHRMALADLMSPRGFRRFLTDILWRTTGPGNEGLMGFLDRLWDRVCPESGPGPEDIICVEARGEPVQ